MTTEPLPTREELERLLDGITPGEWYVEFYSPCSSPCVTGSDDELICSNIKTPFRTPNEAKANAHLLAAAPRLARGLLRMIEENERLRSAPPNIKQETHTQQLAESEQLSIPEAERRFRTRFEHDKCVGMTEDQWGEWVDKLPKDEFWAMMELGLSEPESETP